MPHPSRPPNLPDGSTAVTAPQGADPLPVGAAGASAQTSCSPGGVEPASPSVCRTRAGSPAADSLDVFLKRSIFNFKRRTSSGYFSLEGDSLPGSPLSPVTADRATQTPSPTGQVLKHALQSVAEAHGGGPGTRVQHGRSLSPSSTQQRNAARDMQREEFGRELRRIGDEYNRDLLLRPTVYKSHGTGRWIGLNWQEEKNTNTEHMIAREAERLRRRVVIHPNLLPHIQQEHAALLCMGLLFLLIGRIIYLQGSANS
ncbi:bcl-2-like protein 11 isoform X1 [Gymnodraco acuticeps]|uniref:Bcl-2-like protein 11 isoform X1 n=1 Tax=Gymnodraco acuticeps TaxID=8218 RepID=A0A6P8VSC7_GYMAC|nr:bcl-2-like protein 11 isoform X1 [Gymnodraco acuticeps]